VLNSPAGQHGKFLKPPDEDAALDPEHFPLVRRVRSSAVRVVVLPPGLYAVRKRFQKTAGIFK
jgi:hypothetical protein